MKTILAAVIGAATLAVAAPALAQDISAEPNYGDITLSPGFTPDPHLISLRAGGDINASNISGASCSGYITSAPDFRLNWSGKGSLDLILSVVSNSDTTLIVNGPRGEWYCDDDNGDETNPSLTLRSAAGQYDIWIGTFSSGDTKPAVLSISEVSSF
ncbi:MAG: peptidase S1 [Brevundimonas sp.]|nr:MAG: peptidase S1 [Brevundimonas sp.]